MTPSLEGLPTKAKEAPPHEIRLAPLDTNPVFQSLGEDDADAQLWIRLLMIRSLNNDRPNFQLTAAFHVFLADL